MNNFNLEDIEKSEDAKVLSENYSKSDLKKLQKKLIELEEANNKKFNALLNGDDVTIGCIQDVWNTKDRLLKLQKVLLEANFESERKSFLLEQKPLLKEEVTQKKNSDIEIIVEQMIIDGTQLKKIEKEIIFDSEPNEQFNFNKQSSENIVKNNVSCEIDVFFDTMAPIPMLLQIKRNI